MITQHSSGLLLVWVMSVIAGKLPRSYLAKHGAAEHQQLMQLHPNLTFTHVNLRCAPPRAPPTRPTSTSVTLCNMSVGSPETSPR